MQTLSAAHISLMVELDDVTRQLIYFTHAHSVFDVNIQNVERELRYCVICCVNSDSFDSRSSMTRVLQPQRQRSGQRGEEWQATKHNWRTGARVCVHILARESEIIRAWNCSRVAYTAVQDSRLRPRFFCVFDIFVLRHIPFCSRVNGNGRKVITYIFKD